MSPETDLLAGLGHTSFFSPLCTLSKGQISKIQVIASLMSGNALLYNDPSLIQSLLILEAINIMTIFKNLFESLPGGCLTTDFSNKRYLQTSLTYKITTLNSLLHQPSL